MAVNETLKKQGNGYDPESVGMFERDFDFTDMTSETVERLLR